MRTAPSKDAKAVGTMCRGCLVTVTVEASDWVRIEAVEDNPDGALLSRSTEKLSSEKARSPTGSGKTPRSAGGAGGLWMQVVDPEKGEQLLLPCAHEQPCLRAPRTVPRAA